MRSSIDIQAILSNTKFPILLTELNLKLEDILDCLRSLCKDVCYVYIPHHLGLSQIQKQSLYKELNKSILLYNQNTVSEVKSILTKLIDEMIYTPKTSLILTIEFKTTKTRYRYIVVYLNTGSIKVLTPDYVLVGIRSIYDATNIIVKDIARYTNVEELRFLRIVIPLDNDKLNIKFRCFFNNLNIELLILDAVLIMLCVGKLLTEHKPQA